MSPGDGVWASPSRGLLRDGDQIVPELQRLSKEEDVKISSYPHNVYFQTLMKLKYSLLVHFPILCNL